MIKSLPGIYAILCNSIVTELHTSKNIHESLISYEKNKADKCKGILQFAVLYEKDLHKCRKILKDLKKYYKSYSYLKKRFISLIYIMILTLVFISLLTMNCTETPVSTYKSEHNKQDKNINNIIDSVDHLYFNYRMKKLPYKNSLYFPDSINTTKKPPIIVKDSNLILRKIENDDTICNLQKSRPKIGSNDNLFHEKPKKKNVYDKLIYLLQHPALEIYIGFSMYLIFGYDENHYLYPSIVIKY